MDVHDSVRSKKLQSLILAFQANDTLWGEPIVVDQNKIRYNNLPLSVYFKEFDTTKFAVESRFIPAYLITTESDDYKILEPFRMKIIDHIKDMEFSHIRILHDDISRKIAVEIYPLFYDIENKLREFIVSALVAKIGPDFWEFVVSKETIESAKGHISNEPYFIASKKVVGDVMLLYFDALGKIVYGDLPVFTQLNDTLQKVKDATVLKDLQHDLLEGNFQSYFKDCFEKNQFRDKWTKLNKIRNKVAHNSYFNDNELIECKELIDDLNKTIDAAYDKIDTLRLSIIDRESLKKVIDEAVVEEKMSLQFDTSDDLDLQLSHDSTPGAEDTKDGSFETIDQATLLEQLRNTAGNMPFVGLKHFVKDILGSKGFSYKSSYTLINILIDKGILVTEKVENPIGEHDVTTIKIAEKEENIL
jgi:hypothetical protein